jgi:anti-anti-sigma factor
MELLRTKVVDGDPPVLEVDGEIDLASADELRTALEEALASDPSTEVDLSGVSFFDAAGLRILLQVASGRNGHGPLALRNPPRGVTWILEIVGLRDLPSIDIRDRPAARAG